MNEEMYRKAYNKESWWILKGFLVMAISVWIIMLYIYAPRIKNIVDYLPQTLMLYIFPGSMILMSIIVYHKSK